MYFTTGGRGMRGQDVWRDVESASREAVSRLRDLFENVATETAERTRNAGSGAWTPQADILEDAGHYYARIELPGMSKDQIEVIWKGEGVILVKGRREEDLAPGQTVVRSTRKTGDFEYHVRLPDEAAVNEETIAARYVDGILMITIEKDGTTGTTIEVD